SLDCSSNTRTAKHISPLFTDALTRRCSGETISVFGHGFAGSVSRRPRLIVAGGLGAAAARQRRTGWPVSRRCPRHVGNMLLFPFVRPVALFRRRHIDSVMQPAVP